MKRVLLFFVAFVLIYSTEAQNDSQESSHVIFLVRHAEKVDNSRDPELSEDGKKRAMELAETLKSTGIDYVHSTNFIRTKETAKPTADYFSKEISLYDPRNLEDFAQHLKRREGRHLVVGHSNTTPRLVKFLGGIPGAPIVEKNEYDRLYIITIGKDAEVSTVLLRYGKKFKKSE